MRHIFSKENRALLSELVRTDFKLRYQGSVLGYAWSLLRPLLMFVILYVVFVKVLGSVNGIPHSPAYLLLGIVIWNFFVEMTSQSLGSIVGRGDLIRKIKIPRWLIILSTSISALINLGLTMIVFAVFAVLNHVELMRSILLLPLILVEVYLLALGLSLFLSAAFVKFRDITYIWEVAIQAGFYITPILYAMSIIHSEVAQKIMLLNPMAQAIQDARYVTITHSPLVLTSSRIFGDGWYMFIPFIVVLVVLLVGITYFRRESKYFAENI